MTEFFPSDNRDLDLDFKDLQTHVARQSSLYDFYASKAAEAREARDRKVNALDARTAQVELEIRKSAAQSGEKLTEAKVSAMVEADPELITLKDEVVTANRTLQDAETKVRALDHKKTMIECAVRMAISNSYETSQSGAVSDYSAENVNREMRKNLNNGRG